MNVTREAVVIMGVRVQRKQTESAVTRYDPVTGEPYQTRVMKTYWEMPDGNQLDPALARSTTTAAGELNWVEVDEFAILGITICTVRHDALFLVDRLPDPNKLDVFKTIAVARLKRCGIMSEPQLHLAMVTY